MITCFGHNALYARTRRVNVRYGFGRCHAMACFCSCSIVSRPNGATAEAEVAAPYHQAFSGLVISTQRVNEPVVAPAAPDASGVVESSGYWIKSPPHTGFYFVALVRTEKRRSIANNTPCECALRAAATTGRGTFAVAGISITAAAAAVIVAALLLLVKTLRAAGCVDNRFSGTSFRRTMTLGARRVQSLDCCAGRRGRCKPPIGNPTATIAATTTARFSSKVVPRSQNHMAKNQRRQNTKATARERIPAMRLPVRGGSGA